MNDELREAVLAASVRNEVCDAVDEVYRELTAAIELRKPICKTSGRCCRFEEFGHRLYVSTMELAKFVHDWSVVRSPLSVVKSEQTPTDKKIILPILTTDNGPRTTDNRGCPYQIDGLCTVHRIRPFGCRIFFCDETSTDWQHEQYECLHGQLRRLHEQLSVPYHYVEWRFALGVLDCLKTA